MIRRQAADWLSASGRPSRARAWPWVISLPRTASRTSSGSSSRRIRLETVERSRPKPAGELFLGAAVAGEIFAEGGRLVDGVEILALQVLDHRQLEDALVVEVEHPRGNLVELGLDAGAQPALAGDELVAHAHGPDQDRLEHAVLAERIGQRRRSRPG